MAIGLRVEDRLVGAKNFETCKERIMLLLEEVEVWDIVQAVVQLPLDPALLVEFTKKNVKAKRILLNAIKDHMFPHVSGMTYAYQMWESLVSLHHSSNENKKMVMRQKLHNTKMTKTDSVTSFLTRVSQVKDELISIGETSPKEQLAPIALEGFTKKRDSFIHILVAREHFPGWRRMWDDFLQEEIRRSMRSGS